MINDISWSTVIIIVALLLMHMLTLTVLMYKDGITRFCDGVSTEALQVELERRRAASRYRPIQKGWERPVPVPRQSAGALARIAPPPAYWADFQPMYDTSSMPITPYGQWQEPVHSIYGRELRPTEGGAKDADIYSNPYIAASSEGPMTCKNNNSFYF